MAISDNLQKTLTCLPDPTFSGSLGDIARCPSAGGIYLVQITLHSPIELTRPLPTILPIGIYLYVGSAYGPGGLRARLKRHLKDEKSIRWHIDQLTTKATEKHALGWIEGTECKLRAAIEKTGFVIHPIARFGSSDCRDCPSHLLQLLD